MTSSDYSHFRFDNNEPEPLGAQQILDECKAAGVKLPPGLRNTLLAAALHQSSIRERLEALYLRS
jgi:hypothetical protein